MKSTKSMKGEDATASFPNLHALHVLHGELQTGRGGALAETLAFRIPAP
jgi:hypothetical protein